MKTVEIPSVLIDSYETYRTAKLRTLKIMDSPREAGFDRLVMLAKEVSEMPAVGISFIDENRQWFKSQTGMGVSELPRQDPFCNVTLTNFLEPLIINDLRDCELFSEHPLVVGHPKFRFYAGFALTTEDSYAVGTLAVLDFEPRILSPRQTRILSAISEMLIRALEKRVV